MENAWNALLLIRKALQELDRVPSTISLQLSPEIQIGFNNQIENTQLVAHLSKPDSLLPFCEEYVTIESLDPSIDPEEIAFLRFYLPYALTGVLGKTGRKCFTISHFAQTLDGKIATRNGDSKWIGNEENLLHAHRMRALCDGILVGANTVRNDNPRLNVRKVDGPNPKRVVLGGNGNFKSESYHAIDFSTLIFKKEISGEDSDCIALPDNLQSVIDELVNREIYSLYIEGGCYTTSRFLEQNLLDQVQIHFSSKILGSGISSFAFGAANAISDSIVFNDEKFVPIGNEMMFVGNLRR